MSELNPPELIKSIPIVGLDGKPLTETEADNNAPVPFQDFDLYQMLADKVEPSITGLTEVLVGLSEELGEFMGFHKRMMRGDYKTKEEQSNALFLASKELGDILFYMSAWCTIHGLQFGEVPFQNLEKLSKRMEKNLVKGSGDTREEDTELKNVTESSPISPVEHKE
jgi:NTP pyrophosphatase (non-canonical NTP hydrolase)